MNQTLKPTCQSIEIAEFSDKLTRQPISIEIVNFSEKLANQALLLAHQVNVKLQPVMVGETQQVRADELMTEYPSLFNELRRNFLSIQEALESIENAMSRTEL